jgi:cellulose biosynthesis protein BcsQ
LYDLWTESLNRKIRGLRGTNALGDLVNQCASEYDMDYVFYDTGPNIGPLNRVILLDCDHFIIPAACDLFSVRALITLGQTLAAWVRDWAAIRSFAPNDVQLLPGKPHYLGYIPQRFRVYGELKVSTFEEFAKDIDKHIYSDVISVLRAEHSDLADGNLTGTKLGEVKDYSKLVPMAQRAGTPIWMVRGGDAHLKAEAKSTFYAIAKNVLRMTKPKKGAQ